MTVKSTRPKLNIQTETELEVQGKQHESVEQRVARLESLTEAIVRAVDSLTGDVRSLAASFEKRGRPEWTTYFGFAGIILTIVGMVGGSVAWGYGKDQTRLESLVADMGERELEWQFNRGQIHNKVTGLESMTADLDIRLQREMRDVNATTEAKLDAMDKRLQEEITRSAHVDAESRGVIEAAVNSLQSSQQWMQREWSTGMERIRALERAQWGGHTP